MSGDFLHEIIQRNTIHPRQTHGFGKLRIREVPNSFEEKRPSLIDMSIDLFDHLPKREFEYFGDLIKIMSIGEKGLQLCHWTLLHRLQMLITEQMATPQPDVGFRRHIIFKLKHLAAVRSCHESISA